MTTVVNIRSVETWTPKHVYIGRRCCWKGKVLRESPFANPYHIGRRDGDRQAVVARYGAWLHRQSALKQAARVKLTDRILVCWCAPRACHGDILAEYCDEL